MLIEKRLSNITIGAGSNGEMLVIYKKQCIGFIGCDSSLIRCGCVYNFYKRGDTKQYFIKINTGVFFVNHHTNEKSTIAFKGNALLLVK